MLCEVLGLSSTHQVWSTCDGVWGAGMIRDDVREIVDEFLASRGLAD